MPIITFSVGLLLALWLDMTSPEVTAVSLNSYLLCDAVPKVAGVTWFALKLEETGFITRNVGHDTISTLGFSDTEKCYRLLSAVETQVKVNPTKFHTLVGILRSNAALMDCADMINKSYGRLVVNLLAWDMGE